MGKTMGANDGGLSANANAPSYDPVSGNYRPADKMEQSVAAPSGMNPFLKLLKGGLAGAGQGLQNRQDQMGQNRNFYGY